ncbi:MAG: bifunctional diaminohydroxyphosphoribosylaminopyrimidine deaminase/5-amino-6-(5-phosphoribosylamino)uracil reductase RibD [Desulfobacterales bacterium]|jgi:diaminohydroxyphosphoribosylaminopyrimidine deaminase/5-amino-6-(5-phosphoribosylamino)uracil reductase
MSDSAYMQMALELAARGRGWTNPNPMVGAVIVKDGRVLGKGYHQRAGEPHAEVHALEDAGEQARGATLYVTLEPCNHTGRTPPCTQRILQAGIQRVVVAMTDPNPHVAGGGNAYLRDNGIEVTEEIETPTARRLNEVFIKYVTSGRPFITLKCAATLDGRLATRTGHAQWITGPKARAHVHELRHALDGILVGVGTVNQDNPSLTTRLAEGRGRDPVRLILDTHLTIREDAKVLRLKSDSDTLIFCRSGASPEKLRRLSGPGVEVCPLPVAEGRIAWNPLLDFLGGRDISGVLLEGGGRVIGSALRAGVVDKALFFYGPKILGGDDGVPICAGPGPERMDQALMLKDIDVRRFDDDVLIEGYIQGKAHVHRHH